MFLRIRNRFTFESGWNKREERGRALLELVLYWLPWLGLCHLGLCSVDVKCYWVRIIECYVSSKRGSGKLTLSLFIMLHTVCHARTISGNVRVLLAWHSPGAEALSQKFHHLNISLESFETAVKGFRHPVPFEIRTYFKLSLKGIAYFNYQSHLQNLKCLLNKCFCHNRLWKNRSSAWDF